MFVKDIRFSRAVSACADRRRWTIAYWVENTCLLAKARVMLNGYQFRLYPNAEQQQILLRWFGCQRLIYNAKVQEDRYYRRFQRRMVGPVGKASRWIKSTVDSSPNAPISCGRCRRRFCVMAL